MAHLCSAGSASGVPVYLDATCWRLVAPPVSNRIVITDAGTRKTIDPKTDMKAPAANLLSADIVNTALSGTLCFAGRLLYPSYGEAPRPFGIDALWDQVTDPPSLRRRRVRKRRERQPRIDHPGRPRSSGTIGDPRTSRGGATDIRTRCSIMCMNSRDPRKVSSGDATATKSERIPAEKQAHLERGMIPGLERRRSSHPRRQTTQVSARRMVTIGGTSQRVGSSIHESLMPTASVSPGSRDRDGRLRCVGRRRLIRGMEGLEEADQGRGLGGREILALRRHGAAAFEDLTNELILRHARGDEIEGRSALAAVAPDRVAVPALPGLEDYGALPLDGLALCV